MHRDYVQRQKRRSTFRRQWIMTLGAAVREHGINYNNFIYGLNRSNVNLDRKVLANMAINEPYSFKAIVDEIIIQGELQEKLIKKGEMSFMEAVSKNYLVYGPVKPEGDYEEEFPLTIVPPGKEDTHYLAKDKLKWFQRLDDR